MQEEWTEWFEHDGKGCPLQAGTYAMVRFNDGDLMEGFVFRDHLMVNGGCWNWENAKDWVPIIAYRIRKPRALQQLRQLVEKLPERETTDA